MTIKLPTLSMTLDRTGVSYRKGAMIANSVLQDLGIITEEDKSHVIDSAKLFRQRTRFHCALKEEMPLSSKIKGLYFDGRKDDTIYQEKIGSKYYRKVVKEEHITLLEEPETKYLGHTIPKTGKAENITESICDHCETNGIDLSELGNNKTVIVHKYVSKYVVIHIM